MTDIFDANFQVAQIHALALHLADVHKWLEACPLSSADAIFETTYTSINELHECVKLYANRQPDEALAETINAALDEDEWADLEPAPFWRMVAGMAEARIYVQTEPSIVE
jgi:hypothetical protein